jgi:hypothetical protein
MRQKAIQKAVEEGLQADLQNVGGLLLIAIAVLESRPG